MLWQSGIVIYLRYLHIRNHGGNIQRKSVRSAASPVNTYHYMFTYGGPQLFMIIVWFVATPIFYRTFLCSRPVRVRIISVLWLWLAGIVVSYGDVYFVALQAKRLCSEEAGMKIYRTMRADGILGIVGIEDHHERGLKFVESSLLGRPTIRTSIENGEYKEVRITQFMSEVEFKREETELSSYVVKVMDILIERATGSLLSEIVAYEFYPAWTDRLLWGTLGFSWSPPRCDDDYVPAQQKRTHHITEFVRKTINP